MTFTEYHAKNPQIWDLYQKFALQAINAGAKKIGSKAIFERIRWESYMKKGGGQEYKVNNIYTPHYARLFIQVYPQHSDKVELRTSKND